jgi:hypothetical protein
MGETRAKDGRNWRIGTDAEVAWIAGSTSAGRGIASTIPPVFEAYAALELPPNGRGQEQHDQAVLTLLTAWSGGPPWWLGYLDTGADEIVFPDAPRVTLYSGWRYVLIEGGPEQAATWRGKAEWSFWKGALPNLMFPADRSWLVSTRWDDDWTGVGGPAGLIAAFLRHPALLARPVVPPGPDATPPGHQAL